VTAQAPLPRVLVVDDDEDVVDRLTQLLEGAAEVVSTTDWATINRIYFRRGCALVLMDVHLPVLRGDALAKILKGPATGGKRAPVVLFSSADDEELERLAAECVADGWISKSLRGPALLERLLRWL
jgi:CheY-like chemotaxis protein